MSIEAFFDHQCSIYHLKEESPKIGYGITVDPIKCYDSNPAITTKCHFHVKNDGNKIVQNEPFTAIEGTIKLSLPSGTDIRLNDKVVWNDTGIPYRAGIPRHIRGHHVSVTLQREDGIKGAI